MISERLSDDIPPQMKILNMVIPILMHYSRGTKVEKMLTLAPERFTAGFCMVAKVILSCI